LAAKSAPTPPLTPLAPSSLRPSVAQQRLLHKREKTIQDLETKVRQAEMAAEKKEREKKAKDDELAQKKARTLHRIPPSPRIPLGTLGYVKHSRVAGMSS